MGEHDFCNGGCEGCPEDPLALSNAPLGMYHCPYCGMMLVAGIAHPTCKSMNESLAEMADEPSLLDEAPECLPIAEPADPEFIANNGLSVEPEIVEGLVQDEIEDEPTPVPFDRWLEGLEHDSTKQDRFDPPTDYDPNTDEDRPTWWEAE